MDVKCGRWQKAIREEDSSFGNTVPEACREEEVIKQAAKQIQSKS